MSYESLLRSVDLAGVYHMPHGDDAKIVKAAEANGFVVFPVDLRRANNREDLLDTVAHDMAFPEWFGHNYDALFDCLCDLGWRPGEGYLVLLRHCDNVHGRAEADFVNTLKIFEQAAAEWREDGIPFWCLVDMQADGIAWLPTVGPGEQ
ncbi:MAG TPA: barstar family protein [Rhodocyclaceae bacterium]|nr:barstar family protein [Rhodocyclaceae bacterium]